MGTKITTIEYIGPGRLTITAEALGLARLKLLLLREDVIPRCGDPVKDVASKTHPCMLPYAEIPESQRKKDGLYLAVVRAMAASLAMF